jgi:hypothetical protein
MDDFPCPPIIVVVLVGEEDANGVAVGHRKLKATIIMTTPTTRATLGLHRRRRISNDDVGGNPWWLQAEAAEHVVVGVVTALLEETSCNDPKAILPWENQHEEHPSLPKMI